MTVTLPVPDSLTDDRRLRDPRHRRAELSPDFAAFARNHQDVGRYLPDLIETYQTCPRVRVGGRPLDLEKAYAHILGTEEVAACDRCQPVFDRLKKFVDEKFP